jgi:hypothetical protein
VAVTLARSAVRGWGGDQDAARGRSSVDPVSFFTLPLVMFFEGSRAAHTRIATASLQLAQRWSLGATVDEALPDHARLPRIRQRRGVDLCQRGLPAA